MYSFHTSHNSTLPAIQEYYHGENILTEILLINYLLITAYGEKWNILIFIIILIVRILQILIII